ncbi:methyltransferase-like protein 22 isoform X3 [Elgaria multicarinata webbii]|uniref:methyltransferase-like protein 22 isoform X3 n=1 Tax=Elgaria multicarinata webbii TaxID=159646 RepID=UPI002FCD4C89
MDDMMFRSDTVLSDVHLHTPSKRHFMVRLNAVGQPVFLSQFKLLLDKSNRNSGKEERDFRGENLRCQHKRGEVLSVDDSIEDEDSSSSIEKEGNCLKEHTMATSLEDVGKQVWRGAFLLADFILCKQDLFKDCTVLELGGGTGIVSVIVAKAAKTTYCTDIGEDLLDMCERNIALNKHLIEPAGNKVKVRVLDWLKDDFCTDPENSYSWSEKEIAELHDLTTVILAADVFYDDDLTDAFFKTLYRITSNLGNPCAVYLSIEKRFNFTLRHMDVVCEAYSHFRSTLNDLLNIRDGKTRYTIEPVQLSFPQHIVYERVEQLELWKITAERTTPPTPRGLE